MDAILQLWLENKAAVFETDKSQIILGREEICDIHYLGIAAVSRMHARISLIGGNWYIEDLGSHNGTWLNGEKLGAGTKYPLHPGAEIDLAHSTVLIFLGNNDPAAPRGVAFGSGGGARPMEMSRAGIPTVAATPMIGGHGLFKSKKRGLKADEVQFRAAAPASLEPGLYFTVKLMMYREDDFARADREGKSVADKVRMAGSGIFSAKMDEEFHVSLQSPDIVLEDAEVDLSWNGKYASAEVLLLLPEDYAKKQLRLIGRVYSELSVLTDLTLVLQVKASEEQELSFEKCSLRSAFISYSSHDRAEVAARIQGILLSRPDMDLFFDAECLRRGEHWEARLFDEIARRDLFYLFWSRNAAKSEWVQKELAFALERKGPLAVEPVPLEAPEVCPPPESLRDRHFNDWTLRYSNAKSLGSPESE